jgi:hypothetical protein
MEGRKAQVCGKGKPSERGAVTGNWEAASRRIGGHMKRVSRERIHE